MPDGFVVPTAFLDAFASPRLRREGNVGVTVKCNEYTVAFSGLYPTIVLPGSWEVGISYPTSWFDSPPGGAEEGAWLSYLVTECNGCDPGVIVSQTHPDRPQTVIARLREEQPSDTGERARDVAYALAVFKIDYQANREEVVKTLKECLLRPRNSPEDDVCDGKLVKYLANLYWRGDSGLLTLLFGIADRREDVVDDVGSFYADVLDRRPAAALDGLRSLPIEEQPEICEMAFEDDLRFNPPKLERVQMHLRQSTDYIAQTCLAELRGPNPGH
jgi:hypothetical protein